MPTVSLSTQEVGDGFVRDGADRGAARGVCPLKARPELRWGPRCAQVTEHG